MASQAATGIKKLQAEESEAVVFQTVLFYSLAILLVPVAAFIGSKVTLGGILGFETHSCNIWSAVIAVIVLHLMLGLYIYRTFYPAPTKQTKQD
ncbi:vacuolar ATPase assembly integral membrane protein VMA21 homolog [Daphnia magna]|uniref:Vacuolar ATPase assembly integral membrane protein VMA21 homolog n=1 Tax=Daphnia magna TaxID=35525 RepID=A0ABQ9ZWX4_9CRUS|nr:vacuolar ATPase assembly integral membrane protein VMA21 homolog [Daphnia magna]KAK4017034.1 hypothetical protein OUZ56_031990 [Daphnia magna]